MSSPISSKPTSDGTLLQLISLTDASLSKGRWMGGFAYVLFGSGVALILALTIPCQAFAQAQALGGWLALISSGLLIAGFAFAFMERILTYRMAAMKLKIILPLTERLILRAIPSEGTANPDQVNSAIHEVLTAIWGTQVGQQVK